MRTLSITKLHQVFFLAKRISGHNFFYTRNINNTEIWKVIGLAALLGGLYGIFITPFWSEAVDFGQAWAGLVPYDKSPWGKHIFAAPSLQIIIPALLLLMGLQTWTISLIFTAIFCAISFSAVASASFTFSRSILFSIVMTLFFLVYQFSQVHAYPVIYPVMYWQFGQTGQYMALLALSLLANHKPIGAGIIGGLLVGVHAVWGLFFALGTFPIAFLIQKKSFIKLTSSFLGALFFAIGLLYWGSSVMPPKHDYIPPSIPQHALESISEDGPKKNIFDGHNKLFSDAKDAKNVYKAAYGFFFSEIIFFSLCLFLFFIQKKKVLSTDDFSHGNQLLAMVAMPVILAIALQIIKELDPAYSTFSVIHSQLPALMGRSIFNRWLNITNIMVPILIITMLFFFIREKKNWIAFIGFILTIRLVVNHNFSENTFVILAIILLSLGFPISFFYNKFKIQGGRLLNFWKISPFPSLITVSILYLCYTFWLLTTQAYIDRKFLGKDAVDPLVAMAKTDGGVLLLGSYVVGTIGFNPQLRTERPIIVPTDLDVYDAAMNKIISVYCFSQSIADFGEFYTNVQSCFENRSAHEWQVIRQATQASGVITPDHWKLNLPVAINAGGFSYYQLQNT